MREFRKQNKPFIKIDGALLTTKIETGAFLDSEGTNFYKFSQLQEVCKLFKEGIIKQDDTFFVSDLWFPGIEAIKYMAYFRGIRVNIKFKDKESFYKIKGASVNLHNKNLAIARYDRYSLSIKAYEKIEKEVTSIWKSRNIIWN